MTYPAADPAPQPRLDYCPACWKLLPTRRRPTGEIVVVRHRRLGNEGRFCTGSGHKPRQPETSVP
jgi:hypothetical protein